MRSYLLLACVSLATLALFLPSELLANIGTEFGGKVIQEQTDKLQAFLFGPILRMVGIFGFVGSFVHGIAKSSFSPILTYGVLCLAIVIVPLFINSIFVSGMLIP